MADNTPSPTPKPDPRILNFSNYRAVRPGRRTCGCGR